MRNTKLKGERAANFESNLSSNLFVDALKETLDEITPQPEQYKAEKSKLKSLVCDDIWYILEHCGAYIAGGAITSLFTGNLINDLDVYFPNEDSLKTAVSLFYGRDDLVAFDDNEDGGGLDLDFGKLFAHVVTNKSILYRADFEQDVQFMHFDYFNSPEEIFDKFDYTVCMGAFDIAKDEFVLHNDFLKHNAQKYLKFNNRTAFPLISLLRVHKYQEKGYKISKPEMLILGLTLSKLNLESWEDALDHCGGMYGYSLEDVFNTDKDFSLEGLVDQLSNLDPNRLEFIYSHTDLKLSEIFEAAGIEFDDRDYSNPYKNNKLPVFTLSS